MKQWNTEIKTDKQSNTSSGMYESGNDHVQDFGY